MYQSSRIRLELAALLATPLLVAGSMQHKTIRSFEFDAY